MNIEEKDGFLLEKIKKYLNKKEKTDDILVYNKVDSTNIIAKQMASSVKEKKVIVAKSQTKGKGRLGRTFFSPDETGIYMSIIVKPHMDIRESVNLTTLAAVVVVEAIEKITKKKVSIKWVNDVFKDGKKICGILTQASTKMDSSYLEYAIVGIGINVFEPTDIPEELKDIMTSLYEKNEDYEKDVIAKLIAEIINIFFDYYNDLDKKEYVDKYKKYSMVVGKDVYVLKNNTKTKVKVLDIDDECRLIVEHEDKTVETLSSGEISLRLD